MYASVVARYSEVAHPSWVRRHVHRPLTMPVFNVLDMFPFICTVSFPFCFIKQVSNCPILITIRFFGNGLQITDA